MASRGLPGNEPAEIVIFVNGECVRVNRFDNLYVLADKLQKQSVRFIHNGNVIVPALSFAFHNVQDGDSITAINCHEIPTPDFNDGLEDRLRDRELKLSQLSHRFNSHWSHRVQDPEAIFQRVKASLDPRTSREQARISDISRQRFEVDTIRHRQVIHRFIHNNAARSSLLKKEEPAKFETVIVKAQEPSTDMLPGFCL